MNIIDHLSVGVTSIVDGRDFYDPVLGALGISRLAATNEFAAYGRDAVQFLIMTPANRQEQTAGNGTHICFVAGKTEDVDRFHALALRHGGVCEGNPGPRPEYPIPGVYAAFVRDPFGNKLEAIQNGFAKSEGKS